MTNKKAKRPLTNDQKVVAATHFETAKSLAAARMPDADQDSVATVGADSVMDAARTYDGRIPFEAFLAMTVKRRALDFARSNKPQGFRRQYGVTPKTLPLAAFEEGEAGWGPVQSKRFRPGEQSAKPRKAYNECLDVEAIIAKGPHKQVMRLLYAEGMSQKEVARAMGKSESLISKMKAQALDHLRKLAADLKP